MFACGRRDLALEGRWGRGLRRRRQRARRGTPTLCDAGPSGGGAGPSLSSSAPSGGGRGRGRVLGGAAPRPARSRSGGGAGRARPRDVSAAGAGARAGAPARPRGFPGVPAGGRTGARAAERAGQVRAQVRRALGPLGPGQRPACRGQPSATHLRRTGRWPGGGPRRARLGVCPRGPPAERRPPRWQAGSPCPVRRLRRQPHVLQPRKARPKATQLLVVTVVMRRPHPTQLYQHVPDSRWPIVYSPRYNITFLGLERLHPFDAGKWGKVISFLKEEKLLSDSTLVEAREASDEDLLVVHTRRYLNELKWSFAVATITEIPPVIFLPNFLVQRKVLRPLRTQTGGTIMAGKLAVDRGWAINVGGGFHHCSSDRGGGFCAYADITLAIKFLFDRVEGISKATIVDLDAHQGNGHERDFMGDKRVYIMDVYNRHIYPGDRFAKQAIRRKVELEWGTEDDEYLQKVERNLEKALQEHRPDVVVYNAGTDILEGDRLGGLAISPQGVVKRDELVFRIVRGRQLPILMVTSGGYQKRTARIIADSILNLYGLGLIGPESASVSAQNSDTPLLPLEVP